MLLILCWAIAACAGIPLLMLAAEAFVGAFPDARQSHIPAPPFVVLIPAHDEAHGIDAVIRAVRNQLRGCDRLLVVADNCTDSSAAIARAADADVVERYDPDRRGKAYALAYGRAALRQDAPPSIVIIVDADCLPGPGALPRLAAHAARYESVVQGCYLLTISPHATPLVRVSCLAFMVKNMVRQRGLARLSGGHALLQGTGMAFPWRTFDTAPLETSSLVEDLKLGLDLTLAGSPVRFDSHALFTSHASAQAATQGQRTRWEHGSIVTALHYIPRLLSAGMTGRPALLPIAMDLTIAPLALLALGAMAILALLAGVATLGGPVAPVVALLGAGVMAAGALLFIWLLGGRKILPSAMIVQLPRYLLWKLPIYRRLMGGRQKSWVRTSREPD
jgi:cellulose synthase/poly-beta-1,6-N-acetylglucosamine synthase-like glycosyltransferase